MTTTGLLLIADITGYTTYLKSSELEHAKDSLASLLQLLIDHTKAPLIISRLEGDAVISYSPDGSFRQGQTVVEMIEQTYLDFRRALEMMMLNTSCTCNACRNIPNLDLKFFVHYGSFVRQPLHGYTELVGTDVNLLHRITKNTVAEEDGLIAYVLYTEAAIDGLGIQEMVPEMIRHVDSGADFGELTCYLQDVHMVWEQRRDEGALNVQPENAVLTVSQDLPVPQLQTWDLVTTAEYRSILDGSDHAHVEKGGHGRIGAGSIYYCAHGTTIVEQTVVDWRPPTEYTYAMDLLFGLYGLTTVRLTPMDDGTRLTILAGEIERGRRFTRSLFLVFTKTAVRRSFISSLERVRERILIDVQDESRQPGSAPAFKPGDVAKSVRESLER
ncbi:MAG: DUF2652 domain-containing protein [Anaerolineales bacterium]